MLKWNFALAKDQQEVALDSLDATNTKLSRLARISVLVIMEMEGKFL